jgi:hypothetical protein
MIGYDLRGLHLQRSMTQYLVRNCYDCVAALNLRFDLLGCQILVSKPL